EEPRIMRGRVESRPRSYALHEIGIQEPGQREAAIGVADRGSIAVGGEELIVRIDRIVELGVAVGGPGDSVAAFEQLRLEKILDDALRVAGTLLAMRAVVVKLSVHRIKQELSRACLPVGGRGEFGEQLGNVEP